jgi:hypothetical protein
LNIFINVKQHKPECKSTQNDDFCLTTRVLRTRLHIQHWEDINKPEVTVAVTLGTSQEQQVRKERN